VETICLTYTYMYNYNHTHMHTRTHTYTCKHNIHTDTHTHTPAARFIMISTTVLGVDLAACLVLFMAAMLVFLPVMSCLICSMFGIT
jgi:hypothetical protein